MLTQQKLITLLREQTPNLASEFGIRRIGLFGSFAKGHPSENSDVDLIVEFDHPIGLQFVELVERLESLLGRKVDVLTPTGIKGIRRRSIADSIAGSVVYV